MEYFVGVLLKKLHFRYGYRHSGDLKKDKTRLVSLQREVSFHECFSKERVVYCCYLAMLRINVLNCRFSIFEGQKDPDYKYQGDHAKCCFFFIALTEFERQC